MSRKTVMTVGFLSMLAATLAFSVSDNLAVAGQGKQGKKEQATSAGKKKAHDKMRVDVEEMPMNKGDKNQPDSMEAKHKHPRQDVIEDVGSKGDVYPSTGGPRKDVQEEINE